VHLVTFFLGEAKVVKDQVLGIRSIDIEEASQETEVLTDTRSISTSIITDIDLTQDQKEERKDRTHQDQDLDPLEKKEVEVEQKVKREEL